MADRIYVGNGKKKEFDNGGSIVNASICLDDLYRAAKEHKTVSEKNGKSYIKLNIASMREPDDYENTHYIEVNTWKPEREETPPLNPEEDDIPF